MRSTIYVEIHNQFRKIDADGSSRAKLNQRSVECRWLIYVNSAVWLIIAKIGHGPLPYTGYCDFGICTLGQIGKFVPAVNLAW